jgi:hypothetical protein
MKTSERIIKLTAEIEYLKGKIEEHEDELASIVESSKVRDYIHLHRGRFSEFRNAETIVFSVFGEPDFYHVPIDFWDDQENCLVNGRELAERKKMFADRGPIKKVGN